MKQAQRKHVCNKSHIYSILVTKSEEVGGWGGRELCSDSLLDNWVWSPEGLPSCAVLRERKSEEKIGKQKVLAIRGGSRIGY